jgi:DUF1680 family protein
MDTSKFTDFIPLKDISITDSFWMPIMERVRTEVIPYQWEALNDRIPGAEPSYAMLNFKLAAELTHPELDYGIPRDKGFSGMVFQDSDLAKWIEAAAYTLVWHPDEGLENTIDDVIEIVCSAQQEDGYLDTYYIVNGLEKRFTNLKDNHELYCYGHFLEAAVAYYSARGKRKLLDALIKYTDCIIAHIGLGQGKIPGYPGHETAELALLRLFAITKDEKHLAQAKYFIDQRGQKPLYFEVETAKNGNAFNWHDSYIQYQYYQAGKPVKDQHIAEGHAVRATYLYSGMTDLAKQTGDDELFKVCGEIFSNIQNRQMYITGGIGQSSYGEAFSYDWDLPNDTVYAETCASIGLAFFAKRMSSVTPKAEYTDVLERVLYNGIISGMSLDGKSFFYVNPLEVIPEACLKDRTRHHVKLQRQKWFACACCPPNLARIMTSLGNYIHSEGNSSLYTHLYIGSEAKFAVGITKGSIKIETRYPWEERVDISFILESGGSFAYCLRIPGWCKKHDIKLNGAPVNYNVEDGYAVINREWSTGDKLSVEFSMPVVFNNANPRVRENIGKTAVTRGPVVYCMEESDNGPGLWRLHAGGCAGVKAEYEKDLLGGVVTVTFQGKREKDWASGRLYSAEEPVLEDAKIKLVPYYVWANRTAGEMTVWMNR